MYIKKISTIWTTYVRMETLGVVSIVVLEVHNIFIVIQKSVRMYVCVICTYMRMTNTYVHMQNNLWYMYCMYGHMYT